MDQRKVILYISTSLDGFIAGKNDDLSWLSMVEKEGEDYGYHDFTSGVDTYIVGRKTYEKVLEITGAFPQSQQFDCYVLTRQERENENGIQFYNGDVAELIQQLKTQEGKNIYCDGGGEVVKALMEFDLIDEYRIFVVPIILGDGKRLFLGDTPQFTLEAEAPHHYDTGLIRLTYKRNKEY